MVLMIGDFNDDDDDEGEEQEANLSPKRMISHKIRHHLIFLGAN